VHFSVSSTTEGGNNPLNLKIKKIGECGLYLLQEHALYSRKCKIALAKKNKGEFLRGMGISLFYNKYF